jgi:hypothetical protein
VSLLYWYLSTNCLLRSRYSSIQVQGRELSVVVHMAGGSAALLTA